MGNLRDGDLVLAVAFLTEALEGIEVFGEEYLDRAKEHWQATLDRYQKEGAGLLPPLVTQPKLK